jgi:hypothetical protein
MQWRVGQMLPDIVIPSTGGAPIPLRSDRGEITVVFCPHPWECAAGDRYLETIAELEPEFRVWEARLLVLASAEASLVAADRYGQIFYAVQADATHQLPSPRELTEWLKHLGTLCPE